LNSHPSAQVLLACKRLKADDPSLNHPSGKAARKRFGKINMRSKTRLVFDLRDTMA